jgi:hypothetical protein
MSTFTRCPVLSGAGEGRGLGGAQIRVTELDPARAGESDAEPDVVGVVGHGRHDLAAGPAVIAGDVDLAGLDAVGPDDPAATEDLYAERGLFRDCLRPDVRAERDRGVAVVVGADRLDQREQPTEEVVYTGRMASPAAPHDFRIPHQLVGLNVQGGRKCPNRPGMGDSLPKFDPRDGGPAHAGTLRKLVLRQEPSMPQQPYATRKVLPGFIVGSDSRMILE